MLWRHVRHIGCGEIDILAGHSDWRHVKHIGDGEIDILAGHSVKMYGLAETASPSMLPVALNSAVTCASE